MRAMLLAAAVVGLACPAMAEASERPIPTERSAPAHEAPTPPLRVRMWVGTPPLGGVAIFPVVTVSCGVLAWRARSTAQPAEPEDQPFPLSRELRWVLNGVPLPVSVAGLRVVPWLSTPGLKLTGSF